MAKISSIYAALRVLAITIRGDFITIRGDFITIRGDFITIRGDFVTVCGDFCRAELWLHLAMGCIICPGCFGFALFFSLYGETYIRVFLLLGLSFLGCLLGLLGLANGCRYRLRLILFGKLKGQEFL